MPGFMQRGDAWSQVAARAAHRRRPTRMIELTASDLDGCVEAIRQGGSGCAVVGYSLGARLTLHAALRQPCAFRALVLVGATPGIDNPAKRRSRRAADEDLARWMEATHIRDVVDYWESQSVFATQDERLRRAQRPGRLSHDPKDLATLLRATGQGVLDPLWDRLHEIRIPVLAVAGSEDHRYVAEAEWMAAALPAGTAAVIDGTGHAPHLEDPEGFGDLLLDFLDEHLGQVVVVDGDA